MKNSTLLLVLILILGSFQTSFGAFPVKKKEAIINLPATDYGSAHASAFSTRISPLLHKLDGNHHTPQHRRRDNTLGLLSLIFGIVGLVGISFGGSLLSIAAIVLGAIGMKHRERYSVAGLVLGIVGVALLIIVVAVAIAIISSGI